MPTATQKPITVEFIRYDGENHQEVLHFTNYVAKYTTAIGGDDKGHGHPQLYKQLSIQTVLGEEEIISAGDYVIKNPGPGSGREFYPLPPEIFLGSYNINQ